MPPLLGFDGASPFDLAAAKRHGGIVATVYVVGNPGGFPHADKARVAAIHKAGMGVLPNWERAADFFRTASLADCRAAGAEALAACRELGFPDDGSIGVAFSFDYEVPASGFAWATEQLKACGAGMGGHYRPLGYGQIDLIEYWATHGLPGPHWLMGSTWRATSQFAGHEVGSPHVALVQSHDAAGGWLTSPVPGTDINTVTRPQQLAAWWPPGSPYATPVPSDLLEEIMALSGAPKTYAEFLDDVRAAVSAAPVTNAYGDKGTVEGLLRAIDKHVNDGGSAMAAVAAVVNDTVKRVAQLQAAQAATPAGPPAPAGADADALASAVAAAVVAELGKLSWGVK